MGASPEEAMRLFISEFPPIKLASSAAAETEKTLHIFQLAQVAIFVSDRGDECAANSGRLVEVERRLLARDSVGVEPVHDRVERRERASRVVDERVLRRRPQCRGDLIIDAGPQAV